MRRTLIYLEDQVENLTLREALSPDNLTLICSDLHG